MSGWAGILIGVHHGRINDVAIIDGPLPGPVLFPKDPGKLRIPGFKGVPEPGFVQIRGPSCRRGLMISES